jgi:hypothetical protein
VLIARPADGYTLLAADTSNLMPSEVEALAWSAFDALAKGGVALADGSAQGKVVESYVYRGADWKVAGQVVTGGDSWLLGVSWDPQAWSAVANAARAGELALEPVGQEEAVA